MLTNPDFRDNSCWIWHHPKVRHLLSTMSHTKVLLIKLKDRLIFFPVILTSMITRSDRLSLCFKMATHSSFVFTGAISDRALA